MICANSDNIEKTKHGTSADVGMLQPAAPAVGLWTEERHSGCISPEKCMDGAGLSDLRSLDLAGPMISIGIP